VLVPLLGSIAFWIVRPEATGQLVELTKALYQFRGSLKDIVGFQGDTAHVTREGIEDEAAKALIQKDRPS
jgi:hypothetical protein